MDSSELRLLILVLGILFVAALYLWERHKSSHAQHNRRKKLQRLIDTSGDPHDDHGRGHDRGHSDAVRQPAAKAAGIDDGEHPGIYGEEPLDDEPPVAVHRQESAAEIPAPPQREEILSLSVASKRKFFTGDAIVSALCAADLSPGPMDIYYRFGDDRNDTLFAVASMVNPGTFPKDMSRFRSAGLSLFARLPASRDGGEIFEAMYAAAQLLAEKLDGRLLGADHRPLSEAMLAEMRALANSLPAKGAAPGSTPSESAAAD
jgi:cell division protein ZipA